MSLRSSGLRSRTRVIAPCFVRLQGPPVVLFLFPPKGRAERQGVSPRPRRHVPEHMAPCAESTRQTQPRKQHYACVPHANGLCGLLHVPGVVTGADAPPFVRAVARTCTWTVRPFCRRLSLSAFARISDPRQRPKGPASLRPPHPAPRFEDDRHAPLIGAGWPINFPSAGNVKRRRNKVQGICFLKTRKRMSPQASRPKTRRVEVCSPSLRPGCRRYDPQRER